MTAERFTPTLDQLTRLSEEAYRQISEITLRRLLQIEASAEIPDPEDLEAIIQATLIEQQRLESQLVPVVEETIEGETVETFERKISEAVTAALLLALLMGIGGTNGLRQLRNGRIVTNTIGQLIRGQHRAIARNADKLIQGSYTLGQLRAIPRRRAISFRSALETSQHAYRMAVQGHNEGKRFINSAHPCPDCPAYQRLDWSPISEIVPPATLCRCQGYCKCTVTTRFNPQRAIQELQGGSLLNQVQRSRDFLEQAEQDFLSRNDWL